MNVILEKLEVFITELKSTPWEQTSLVDSKRKDTVFSFELSICFVLLPKE